MEGHERWCDTTGSPLVVHQQGAPAIPQMLAKLFRNLREVCPLSPVISRMEEGLEMDVLEEMWGPSECDVRNFGALYSSDKAIATPEYGWLQTA